MRVTGRRWASAIGQPGHLDRKHRWSIGAGRPSTVNSARWVPSAPAGPDRRSEGASHSGRLTKRISSPLRGRALNPSTAIEASGPVVTAFAALIGARTATSRACTTGGRACSTDGDACTAAGEAPNPVGDASSVVGEAPNPVGDASSVVGEAPNPVDDASSVVGEAPNPAGDASSAAGEAPNPVDDASSVAGEAPNPAGDACTAGDDVPWSAWIVSPNTPTDPERGPGEPHSPRATTPAGSAASGSLGVGGTPR